MIAMVAAIALAGAVGGATIWMLHLRNEPPQTPRDTAPCLTAARDIGIPRERLEMLAEVSQGGGSAVDRIKIREELRRRDLPSCDWVLRDLGAGRP